MAKKPKAKKAAKEVQQEVDVCDQAVFNLWNLVRKFISLGDQNDQLFAEEQDAKHECEVHGKGTACIKWERARKRRKQLRESVSGMALDIESRAADVIDFCGFPRKTADVVARREAVKEAAAKSDEDVAEQIKRAKKRAKKAVDNGKKA
ncbi:MAG: hypothetical protein AMS21_00845 [Gemmatimonas sp. SG8_38_2]|nr:MAG: hypothetical protein AMS21_00845 [Gemmatimonas sp. SG8_38_2]